MTSGNIGGLSSYIQGKAADIILWPSSTFNGVAWQHPIGCLLYSLSPESNSQGSHRLGILVMRKEPEHLEMSMSCLRCSGKQIGFGFRTQPHTRDLGSGKCIQGIFFLQSSYMLIQGRAALSTWRLAHDVSSARQQHHACHWLTSCVSSAPNVATGTAPTFLQKCN